MRRKITLETFVSALSGEEWARDVVVGAFGKEAFESVYEARDVLLKLIKRRTAVYVLDGYYVVYIYVDKYVEVERKRLSEVLMFYLPLDFSGFEVGKTYLHYWVILRPGLRVYEVRNVADIRSLFSEIVQVLSDTDGEETSTIIQAHMDAALRMINEFMLEKAISNVQYGVDFLRGLLTDTIVSLLLYGDEKTVSMFIDHIKERYGPLIEALDIMNAVKDEVKEIMRMGRFDEVLLEKRNVLKKLGVDLDLR